MVRERQQDSTGDLVCRQFILCPGHEAVSSLTANFDQRSPQKLSLAYESHLESSDTDHSIREFL